MLFSSHCVQTPFYLFEIILLNWKGKLLLLVKLGASRYRLLVWKAVEASRMDWFRRTGILHLWGCLHRLDKDLA